jgi:hypothetical protein
MERKLQTKVLLIDQPRRDTINRLSAVIILAFCLLMFNAQSQTYDPLAVQRINGLIANNGLQATPNAPDTWDFAEWNHNSPGQLIGLYISNKNITGTVSLSGLYTLWYLYCQENDITELDITDCISIMWLDCSENRLTYLEVANLEYLSILRCSFNKLSELDLSNCKNLVDLECGFNNLTQLNLTNCPNLKFLHCSDNLLSELDVCSSTLLEHLSVAENNLTRLDVTYNTKLQRLDVGYNKLTELNVSKCPELLSLLCEFNCLTTLNLTYNPNLETLYCYNNNLTELDLRDLNNLTIFYGQNQSVPLSLVSDGNGDYTRAITLNTPTFGNSAISYREGILKSTGSSVSSTGFTVQTGKPGFELSGTMNFTYSDVNIFSNKLANSLIAYISNERLYVSGLKPGDKWSVYTVSGVLVYQGVAVHEEESIVLRNAGGIYIVRSGGRAVKVIL